jgi:hypothetical protein
MKSQLEAKIKSIVFQYEALEIHGNHIEEKEIQKESK